MVLLYLEKGRWSMKFTNKKTLIVDDCVFQKKRYNLLKYLIKQEF